MAKGSALSILFCTHEPLLPLTGGCTLGNLRLVEFLASRGHTVTVISPLNLPLSQAQIRFEGLAGRVILKPFQPWTMHRGIGLRFPKYLLYAFLYLWALFFMGGKPDVVIVRNAVLAIPVLKFAYWRKVPAVISYTDMLSALLGEDKTFPRVLIKMLAWYERWIPSKFDRVTVISPALRGEVLKGGIDLRRISVSLDGADASLFNPARYSSVVKKQARRELGVKAGHRLVFFHGTVEAHHGQAMLAGLVKKITGLDGNLHVAVVAGGPGYTGLQAELEGLPRVTILPFQLPETVARLAAAADCGIIPYPPGFGLDLVFTLKLLEYFALGLPAVCFRLASAEAVFGKSGRLLTSSDENVFAANVVKAARMKKSPATRKAILKDFSWEAVCGKIGDLLEETSKL